MRVTCVVLMGLCMNGFLPGMCRAEPQDAGTDRIHVAFRYDDYVMTSSNILSNAIGHLFAETETPLTIAMIPAMAATSLVGAEDEKAIPLADEKVDDLRNMIASGLIDIGIHGFEHRNYAPYPWRSEFAGQSLPWQASRLRMAKNHVEQVSGMDARVFVPPWGAYDENTIAALDQHDVPVLSAGLAPSKNTPSVQSAVISLPKTVGLFGLHKAIDIARKSGDPTPLIVCVFHEVDLRPPGKYFSVEDLRGLLAKVRSNQDVHVTSLAEFAKDHPGYTLTHANNVSVALETWARLPHNVQDTGLLHDCVYPSPDHLRHITAAFRRHSVDILYPDQHAARPFR